MPCRDSGYNCTTCGILCVLQEAFLNDHLLEKDESLFSSTIQRIWHLLPGTEGNAMRSEKELRREPKIRQYLFRASKAEVDCSTILLELILTVVFSDFGLASGNIS